MRGHTILSNKVDIRSFIKVCIRSPMLYSVTGRPLVNLCCFIGFRIPNTGMFLYDPVIGFVRLSQNRWRKTWPLKVGAGVIIVHNMAYSHANLVLRWIFAISVVYDRDERCSAPIYIQFFWCWRRNILALGATTMPADVLSPNFARASAGKVLSI